MEMKKCNKCNEVKNVFTVAFGNMHRYRKLYLCDQDYYNVKEFNGMRRM